MLGIRLENLKTHKVFIINEFKVWKNDYCFRRKRHTNIEVT